MKIKRFLIRIFLFLVLAAAICVGLFYGWKKINIVKYQSQRALVERQLIACSELVTYRYQYSDIITIKKTAMWSKSYSIIKYSGIIRAGIEDLGAAEYEISQDRKSIKIILPKTKILGNELVSQELFDEKQSLFVPISTQDVFDEISTSKELALNDLLSRGFLQEAENHAREVMLQLFLAMGFEEVDIK